MKKAAILIFVLLIISMFAACSMLSNLGDNSDKVKDVKSSDGLLQLTVPESYDETDVLNDVADIQVMNAAKEQYTIVIFESKVDFSDSITLDDYRDAVMQNMELSVESPEFSDAESLTINGYNAQQFTLSGEVSKIKVKYLITMLETDSGFCQILSWSLQSRYDAAEEIFKQIADSFTEL